ncbi:MAG TPA: glycosyltransferase family 39 protein [Caldilineae bacterium]|nr:glycosyltransferase family 39 protein [Caldilineae bacterium]
MQGLSEQPVAGGRGLRLRFAMRYIWPRRWIRSIPWRSRTVFLAIALGYLLLAIGYSVIIPLWEADNEWAHYRYARYIVTHRALPDPTTRQPTERPPIFARRKWPAREWHQFSQPPLYYLLAAAVIWPVDISDNPWPVPNPYVHSSTGAGGVNFAIHGPEEAFPYRGTALAVHLIRWLSAALGLLALAGVYRLARTIAPGCPEISLGATALTAFSPQFLFAASTVNNDILVTATGAWTLVYGLRVMRSPTRLRYWALMALWLSLALLSKYNALVLVPFVLLSFLVGLTRLIRRRETSTAIRALLGSTSLLLIIAGGWLIHNRIRYGRFITRYPNIVDRLVDDVLGFRWMEFDWLTWERLRRAMVYSFETYWASFGWGNLGLPRIAYQLLAVFCALAVAGAILRLARIALGHREDRTWRISLLFAGIILLAWIGGAYKALRTGEGYLHGRYLLPVLSAISFLLVWGVSAWFPVSLRRLGIIGLGGIFLAFAGWTVIGPIRTAYAPPTFLTEVTLPPEAQLLNARFGENAELVAYEIWPETIRPGEALGVRLLWRVLKPLDRNYTVGVHLLGEGQVKVGETNIYPGRGNYATTLWQSGRLFWETYWVTVEEPIARPIMGRVKVALFIDDDTQAHLPVTDAQGNPLGNAVIFGRFKLAPAEPPTQPIPRSGLARLGDIAQLTDATLQTRITPLGAGDTFTVTLTWHALARPQRDYIVFLHVAGEGGPLAFGDGPPVRGEYPTSLWERGERIEDVHTIRLPADLPAGEYKLFAGLYDPEGQRLAAYTMEGERLPADQVPLGSITVVRRDQRSFIPLVMWEGQTTRRKRR